MAPKMAYRWKEAAHVSVSAQVAGDELSRIRSSQGEFFTPAAVVLASRPEDAPLHPAFEWDDSKAAAAHRENQAKYIIRNIVVEMPNRPNREPTRAFVSVRNEDDKHRYTTMVHAMSDADLREQVLAQALADMQAFERKYSQILDLSGVRAAFDVARLRASQEPSRLAS